MKILLVDDSAVARKMITPLLKNYFHSVSFFEASDGHEALEILQSTDIDFVFLDWNMPNMNGEQVLDNIRSDEKFNSLKIIMVTTEGGKEKVSRLVKKGVNGYVVKPIHSETLYHTLDRIVARMRKVLIADDSKVIREYLQILLPELIKNPIFYEAEDGAATIEHLKQTTFEYLFLDWNMPNVNGEEVLNYIRRHMRGHKMKIVMVTSEGARHSVLNAKHKGAHGYVVKPFDEEHFKESVQKVIATSI